MQDQNESNAKGNLQVHWVLLNELAEYLYAQMPAEPTNSAPKEPIVKTLFVCSSSGEYVEIKDAVLVEINVPGTYFVHRPIKGEGYVISEGDTGLKVETGPTADIALGKARTKLNTFIETNGIEAFQNLLSNAKSIKDKSSEEKPIDEPLPVEEKEQPKPIVQVKIDEASTIEEAITMSLNFKNSIDLEYISELLNQSMEDVESLIHSQQLAFLNPDTNLLESPEEYLSGNIRTKLKKAEEAMVNDSRYEFNIEKLKEIIPEIIPSGLIQYSLGASWIPVKIFEAFAHSIFKTKTRIVYSKESGKFSVYETNRTIQIKNTYAAGGKSGVEILNSTMNNQQMVITESDGGKQVKNLDKTSAAQSMQEQLQDEFQAFIRCNKEFEDETELLYNELFNSHVHRDFRIPTLTHYPGASEDFFLREHQKKAVLRAMNESTLFAHSVGSGKTGIIITTAMELKRLNLAEKPLIVVQNKTRGQFITEFRSIYPNANILAPTDDELSSVNRGELYHKIAYQDWDSIIIPHSQLPLIPDDLNRQKKMLKEQIDIAEEIFWSINKKVMPMEYNHSKRTLKMLKNELAEIELEEEERQFQRERLAHTTGSIPLLNFEQMNIDALLIDEAHILKRLGFATQMNNIKGIDTSKSKRSQSALLKMRWIQDHNGGRNTLFYTGTPISNTMAEAWTMIRYIRPDILKDLGIEHFDQFAKTFGQVIPSLEQTGGGTFKIQNRFAKFQNLPEFITAFRACTDVILPEDIPEFLNNNTIPKLRGGQITQVIVPRSPELKEQIDEFREKLEWFEGLEGADKKKYSYIPMVIFGKAKQASIDLRLLNPLNKDSPDSKVNQVIERALEVYKRTGRVIMIFSDLYQSPEPKDEFLDEDCQVPNPAYGVARFNLFNDIKKKLVLSGLVRENEIAILTEPKYSKMERLEKLLHDANRGIVKWLLGTTSRLGVGVNAQRLLAALFHIDAPGRPMDFEQRNGRILRQGNLNAEVEIFAFGVEKTLDSAAFQRLSLKQRFINQIMKGNNLERVMDDAADESQMTFDEMMAHLSDSPYAMQKLLVDNRLKSEYLKRDNFTAKQVQTNRQLNNLVEEVKGLEIRIKEETKYSDIVQQNFPDRKILEVGHSYGTASGEDEDMELLINDYILMLINRYEVSPTLTAMGVVTINGVKVNLNIKNVIKTSPKTKIEYNMPSLSYTMPDVGIYENVYGNGVRVEGKSANNLFSSIRRELYNIVNSPEYLKGKVESYQISIAELDRNMQLTFDETRIEQLEAEIEVLKQKMMGERVKEVEEQVSV